MKYEFDSLRIFTTIALVLLIAGCDQSEIKSPIKYTAKSPYLGETPPGEEPKIFAPGIVSKKDVRETKISFSPDGKEIYWSKPGQPERDTDVTIWFTREEESGWSEPHVVPFAMKRDISPFFMHDNKRFLFFSGSGEYDELATEKELAYVTYVVERTGDSWSKPKFFHRAYSITASTNGNMYFNTVPRENRSRELAMFKEVNGEFTEPVDLAGEVNSEHYEHHPAIAPDESYILFDSFRPGEINEYGIYVSFRKDDGSWGKAINLGEKINNVYSHLPMISPDGKYIFFQRDEDIWWVSTSIIDRIKETTQN